MLFYQPSQGYCFNSDSIFLYDFISSYLPKGRVLDVGCGVGVIGLLLARDFNIDLTMVEKQDIMVKFAQKNIEINKIKANLVKSDFLEFSADKPFEFIVSNPPFYHPDVIQSQDSHINACRYNTHLPIESFLKKVATLLSPRGHFIFCYDAKQLPQLLKNLNRVKLGVEELCMVHPKTDRIAKLAMIHARKNSKAMLKVLPPFILFKDGKYNTRAQEIFKKVRTHTIKCQML